jgi:hypothetical protein
MALFLASGVLDSRGGAPPGGRDTAAVAAWVEGGLWKDALEARRRRLVATLVVGGLGLALGLILLAVRQPVAAAVLAVIFLGIAGLLGGTSGSIVPAQRVTAVHRLYLPVMALPLEGKTVFYDLSGVTPLSQVRVQTLNHAEDLARHSEELAGIVSTLGVFEPASEKYRMESQDLWGVDGRLAACLSATAGALADTTSTEAALPVLRANDPLVAFVRRAAPRMSKGDAGPCVQFEALAAVGWANRQVEGVHSASVSSSVVEIDDILSRLQSGIETTEAKLRTAHEESLALLQRTSSLALHTMSWPAFAVYCPSCNTPQPGQEPRLSKATHLFEDAAGRLYCPVCRAETEPLRAVQLTRMRDQLFYPLLDQIRLSLHEEILAIDRDIENQLVQIDKESRVKGGELKLQADQQHRARVAQLRQHRARAGGLATQIAGMTASLAKYQKIASDLGASFARECREIELRIETRSREAIEVIERDFAARQARADQASRVIARVNREEVERRHAEVLASNRAIANATKGVAMAVYRGYGHSRGEAMEQMSGDQAVIGGRA